MASCMLHLLLRGTVTQFALNRAASMRASDTAKYRGAVPVYPCRDLKWGVHAPAAVKRFLWKQH